MMNDKDDEEGYRGASQADPMQRDENEDDEEENRDSNQEPREDEEMEKTRLGATDDRQGAICCMHAAVCVAVRSWCPTLHAWPVCTRFVIRSIRVLNQVTKRSQRPFAARVADTCFSGS